MRASTVLLVLALVATRASGDVGVFDPDPQHPWNTLEAALTTEERVPDFGTIGANERIQQWLFSGPTYERALSELDAFVEHKSDGLIRDPLKRALLQSKLWTVFDAVSNPTDAHRPQRVAIAQRASELVRRLALTEAEIAALPDNYAATIAAKSFPARHDPTNEAQPFLPPDLLPVGRGWLAMSDSAEFPPAAARHAEAVQGRSVFYVLIRLPEGIAQTQAYTRKLAYHPRPLAWDESYGQFPHARSPTRSAPDLPQFPAGTQVALVRRMLLPDDEGQLRVTPIVESVQIRVYVTEPGVSAERDRQDAFEFRMSPRHLLLSGSGLIAVEPTVSEVRTIFARQTTFEGACTNCHAAPGIYSVQTYTQGFGRRRQSPWFEAASSDRYLNTHAVNWKKQRYEWGLLQGLWKLEHASDVRR